MTKSPLKEVFPRVQSGRINLDLRDEAGAERPLRGSGRGCSKVEDVWVWRRGSGRVGVHGVNFVIVTYVISQRRIYSLEL